MARHDPRTGSSRLTAALLLTGLLVATTSHSASAQTLALDDIGRRIRPGDTVYVIDRHGNEAHGRVVRIESDGLALATARGERTFGADDVLRIETGDSLWNGTIIGAVPGALIGGLFGSMDCGSHCGASGLRGAAAVGLVGAGLGALEDWARKGRRVVYGAPLDSPSAAPDARPVTSLADLPTRVRQGDDIRIWDPDGHRVSGTFVQASSTFLVANVGGRSRDLAADRVTRVTRRGGNHARQGAIAGALIGSSFGLTAGATGCLESCGMGGVVVAGLLGALWGAGIGACIPRNLVIFESAGHVSSSPSPRGPSVVWTPILGRSAAGFQVAVRF